MSLNKVILMGNLCSTPELKKSTGGVSFCCFQLAVDRRYSKEGASGTDFIPIIAWSGNAEFIHRNFRKGQSIIVCGTLRVHGWKDAGGKTRTQTDVVVDEVAFAGKKMSADGEISLGFTEARPNFEEIPGDEDLPF